MLREKSDTRSLPLRSTSPEGCIRVETVVAVVVVCVCVYMYVLFHFIPFLKFILYLIRKVIKQTIYLLPGSLGQDGQQGNKKKVSYIKTSRDRLQKKNKN